MTQEAPYEVIRTVDGVEIRRYPELLLATVSGMEDDSSFGILFDYITGNNVKRSKLSMTAPVVSSEKLAMTVPVVSSQKLAMTAPVVSGERFFTFVMPAGHTLETLPVPSDKRVRIHVQPARDFAVLEFSGRTRTVKVEQRIRELLDILARNRITTRGEPFLMRYNSPFTPGFMRRNEVGIEILQK
jgi:hypothetical protein